MSKTAAGVARAVKSAYRDADEAMKRIPKVCMKGCSHCCHQNVRVFASEGIAIEQYIDDFMPAAIRSQVKDQLAHWLNYFDQYTPADRPILEPDLLRFEDQAARDKLPCAFLINGECSIYRARPLACRTYCVNDSAALCEQRSNRNGDARGYAVHREHSRYVAKAFETTHIRLLAYAVQEKLEVRHNCKPVEVVGIRSQDYDKATARP